jgi:hypothetical protein
MSVVGGVVQLLAVTLTGLFALPLMIVYLALVAAYCVIGLIVFVHLVGASIGVVVWLIDGGPDELWNTLKLFGIACVWFSLMVVAAYIHSSTIHRFGDSRPDVDFQD